MGQDLVCRPLECQLCRSEVGQFDQVKDRILHPGSVALESFLTTATGRLGQETRSPGAVSVCRYMAVLLWMVMSRPVSIQWYFWIVIRIYV